MRPPGPAAATALAALAALAACRSAAPPPDAGAPPAVVTTGPRPRPVAADAAVDEGSDFVTQQVRLRAAALGRTLRATTPLVRGILPQGGEATHEFDVVAGHCYRIVTVGGVDANDLDVSLFAPDGSEIDNDPPGDSYPTLGAARPFCPPAGGRYRVRVRMASGQGDYGIQLFGTP